MKNYLFLGLTILTTNLSLAQSNNLDFETPKALPEEINTETDELQPVFSKDSSKLYFVRAGHEDNMGKVKNFDQDIWTATQNEYGSWNEAENLKILNNKNNNSVFGISYDASTIYLMDAYAKKKKELTKGVAIANKKNGNWEHHPKKLEIDGFHLHGNFYGYYINESEDVIIISDNGENSVGEEDLYVSKKDQDGKWHHPIHLGNTINSAGFEMSPFLSLNTDTLYFSSNREGGYGDADVYYSVRLDDTWQKWSKPTNLGPNINTEFFEAYFVRSNNEIYFCSDRYGNNDIFHTKVKPPVLPPLSFNVKEHTNPTKKDAIDGDITLHNLEPDTEYSLLSFYNGKDTLRITNITTTSDGTFLLENLPEGKYTDFMVFRDRRKGLNPDQATLVAPVVKDPPLPPYGFGFKDVVYFDLNSSYLSGKSRGILDDMIPRIKKNKDYKITIVGHTDSRADADYNLWLSKRRLKAVTDYFVKNGIDVSIINGEYKGESELAEDCIDCEDDNKHALNRRATINVYTE